MAIALRGAGTAASSATGTVTPSYPAGMVTGDLAMLTVTAKPYTTTVTTPDGWELLTSGTNGTTGSGADTGSTKVYVFRRFTPGSGAFNVVASGSDSLAAQVTVYQKAASETWHTDSFTTGGDSTNGANYSATGGANLILNNTLGFQDWLYIGTAINSDAGTPSSFTISATSSTFDTIQSRVNTGYTAGNDGRIVVVDVPVLTGSSTTAPTFGFTNASSSSGTSGFIRLRVRDVVVTAEFNENVNSPGFDIDISEANSGTTMTLVRKDINGDYEDQNVRGMDGAARVPATTVSDYEVPFVTAVKYTLNIYDASGNLHSTADSPQYAPEYVTDVVAGTPVEFYTKNFYVKMPSNPSASLAVSVSDMRTTEIPGNILGKNHVLGRSKPVVITDTMGGRTGTMRIDITTVAQYGKVSRKKIKVLLDSSEVLLFQSVQEAVDIPDMYFVVDGYSETIGGSVNGSTDLTFSYEVAFTEVDRPATSTGGVSVAGWVEVYEDPAFSSWGDVNTALSTWLNVIQRYS